MRLVTADDVCVALETTLETHMPRVLEAMGWDNLSAVTSWSQVPTADALSSANLPAGTIESPGLTGPPVRNGEGGWDATWRVAAGIFDRGDDYDETAATVRRWAAAIRTAAMADVTLGGLAEQLVWVGEDYARRPERNQARTLGGCAVAFDVTVHNVVELPLPPAPGGTNPIVTSTHRTISVRTQGSSA